jgi:hypothetical protein
LAAEKIAGKMAQSDPRLPGSCFQSLDDIGFDRYFAGWQTPGVGSLRSRRDFDLAMPDAEIETHLCASRGKTAYEGMWRGSARRIVPLSGSTRAVS